jgi:hypothetical protein
MVRPNRFRTTRNRDIAATKSVHKLWALNAVMSALAVIGWGTFAYNAQSPAVVPHQLYDVLAELTVSHVQVIAERDEARAYLATAREALAVLGTRLERVTTERDEIQVGFAGAREEIAIRNRRFLEAQSRETGSLGNPASGKPAFSQQRRTSGDQFERKVLQP